MNMFRVILLSLMLLSDIFWTTAQTSKVLTFLLQPQLNHRSSKITSNRSNQTEAFTLSNGSTNSENEIRKDNSNHKISNFPLMIFTIIKYKLFSLIIKLRILLLRIEIFWKNFPSVYKFGIAASILSACYQYLEATLFPKSEYPFSDFLKFIEQIPNHIYGLKVTPNSIDYIINRKRAFTTFSTIDSSLLEKLISSGVHFGIRPSQMSFKDLIDNVVPLVVLFSTSLHLIFLSRLLITKTKDSDEESMLSKKKEKSEIKTWANLTFDDVAGQDLAREEVKEVCEMLTNPSKYLR